MYEYPFYSLLTNSNRATVRRKCDENSLLIIKVTKYLKKKILRAVQDVLKNENFNFTNKASERNEQNE